MRGIVVSLRRSLTIILDIGTGILISGIKISLVIWQWSLVVRGGILVNCIVGLIYSGRRLVIRLHDCAIGNDIVVVIRWRLVNLRGILVDGRWNLINRRGSIFVSEKRGISVISLCVNSLVWTLWWSRTTSV